MKLQGRKLIDATGSVAAEIIGSRSVGRGYIQGGYGFKLASGAATPLAYAFFADAVAAARDALAKVAA